MDSDTQDSRRSRRNTHTESDELESRRRSRRGKSGWKRPRRILGLWARLALLLGVIVVLVFFAIGLVAKAARPYREVGVQSDQLAATRRESAALVAQNADLTRRIRYLRTTDGIASEARSYGYLRPGERPIMVKGLTPPRARCPFPRNRAAGGTRRQCGGPLLAPPDGALAFFPALEAPRAT